MIGKNLPLRGGLLSPRCPCPLGLTTSLTGFLLSPVGHLFLLLLPSLGSDVAGVIDRVKFGVLGGRFLECDAHIGPKIILSPFRQQRPRKSTRSCLDNIVLGTWNVFGHLLFKFDDAIEEGTVSWVDDATRGWD